VVGSERRTCFETECVVALEGHPRSLILTPIESAYATSYWSSIVTLVLILPRFLLRTSIRPDPYSTRFFWGSAWIRVSKCEDPKLIIRVINYELVQPHMPTVHQRYRGLYYVHRAVKGLGYATTNFETGIVICELVKI